MMKIFSLIHFLSVPLFILQFRNVFSWDNIDLELFDLVEELQPKSFYEVLGVEKDASSADIRRAYRKLSLQLHPDKNKEEGAEQTFRQLVAVAEFLRDEEKRQRYNDILLNGLPNWRQPVFYYRRVRKMGLLETTALLSVILTFGHYIVLWSIYWERKFELESLIRPKKEKKSKKASKPVATEDANTELTSLLENEEFLPRPKVRDVLPFQLCRFLINCWILAIHWWKNILSSLKEKWENRNKVVETHESEEDEIVIKKKEKRPREKQRVFSEIYDFERTSENADQEQKNDSAIKEVLSEAGSKKNTPWSVEDTKALVKSIAKYPGGTSDRWEKIADDVGRSVAEVLSKAKQIKTKGYVVSVDASVQGITGGVNHSVISKQTGKDFIKDNTISIANHDEHSTTDSTRKRHKTPKPETSADRTLMISQPVQSEPKSESNEQEDALTGMESCSWSQRQQKILEKAMTVYPKGTPERWEKIASAVPGKSKEECISRYKELVEIIRRKKLENQ